MSASAARVLIAAGRVADAVAALFQALAADHADLDAARVLGRVLARYQLDPTPQVEDALRIAVGLEDLDLQPFTRGVIDLAKARPAWRAAPVRAPHWRARLRDGDLAPFDDPLLLSVLARAVCHDVALERVLLALRRALLDDEAPPAALTSTLARQAANNEYAWPREIEEELLVDQLALEFRRAPSEAALLRFALYRAPADLDAPDRLRAVGRGAAAAGLLAATLPDPDEQASRESIRRLAAEHDAVSQSVRAQYEENPYPRWLALIPADAGERRPMLQARGLAGDAQRPIEVLVAGAGTGRQAIAAWFGYGAATRITALDLSVASLAYGARMARRYHADGVEFIQGDILDLDTLDRQFDVVESIGVLHHMDHPLDGWAALARRLRPGGLMNIALYSERGRADIVQARAYVAALGLPTTPDGLRRLRRVVLDAPDTAGDAADSPDWRVSVRRFTDFFTASGCRDLLMHVHEQRFTPAQIAAALTSLGLEFRGMVTSAATLGAYRKRFPADPAGLDLANWDAFESEHPTTFAGMINFWCRKPD